MIAFIIELMATIGMFLSLLLAVVGMVVLLARIVR